MSRSLRVPTYRKHEQSGQAIVTLTDGLGGRRDVLLGPYGSAASLAEYSRVLAEWEASRRSLEPTGTSRPCVIRRCPACCMRSTLLRHSTKLLAR